MKIVINGRFLTQNITGVQRYSIEVVREIDRLLEQETSYKVDLIVPGNAQLITKLKLKHIKIVSFGKFSGHLWEQLILPLYPCDLLMCLGNTAPLYSLVRKRVLAVVHDLSYKYFPDAYSLSFRLWYGFIIPCVLKWSKHLFTVSYSEKKAIEALYPRIDGKIQVSPCGGFTREILEEIASNNIDTITKKRQFIYVGSLNPRKNLRGFLEAFMQLPEELGYRAVVIGGGERVFADYGLNEYQQSERIQFLGHINDPYTIAKHYGESCALVFPTYYEASPIPPIEAMNCQCVVIASNIPANKERCGDAALYCDADNVTSIVDAMKFLIANPQQLKKLQMKGKENAIKFTWNKTAEILWGQLKAS